MNRKLKYNTDSIIRKDQTVMVCLYNSAVDCTLRDMADVWFCKQCGWNPEEAAKRKKELDKRFKSYISEDEVN